MGVNSCVGRGSRGLPRDFVVAQDCGEYAESEREWARHRQWAQGRLLQEQAGCAAGEEERANDPGRWWQPAPGGKTAEPEQQLPQARQQP